MPDRDNLVQLYTDANWGAYTKEPEKLVLACKNSQDVISAWDNDKLIGLIRANGDKHTILYIQDILVLKEFKRKGVGSTLLDKLLLKNQAVRQTVLLTDDSEETRGFYEAKGFQSCDKGSLVSFARFQ